MQRFTSRRHDRAESVPEAGPPEPIRLLDRETSRWEYGEFPRVLGEFWTAQQRRMDPLHYLISYRASFKPELPDYFIQRYSRPGDIVLDPFAGRGTTILQANLRDRVGYACDVSPLAQRIIEARSRPVTVEQVRRRLDSLDLEAPREIPTEPDLSMFYHPRTLQELLNLRDHLRRGAADDVDRMIEILALSRLHGHSTGFFSVYSFPQISVPPEGQRRINRRRRQAPEYRAVKPRILKKARASLRPESVRQVYHVARRNRAFVCDARQLIGVPHGAARLIVTSPPFLDKADYVQDNWLELWFLDIDAQPLRESILQTRKLEEWRSFMVDALAEMYRVLRPGGVAAIEVGDVLVGRRLVNLDEVLLEELAKLHRDHRAKFEILELMIHTQRFTKLAHCFNVSNNQKGTNTHRILVLRKPYD